MSGRSRESGPAWGTQHHSTTGTQLTVTLMILLDYHNFPYDACNEIVLNSKRGNGVSERLRNEPEVTQVASGDIKRKLTTRSCWEAGVMGLGMVQERSEQKRGEQGARWGAQLPQQEGRGKSM